MDARERWQLGLAVLTAYIGPPERRATDITSVAGDHDPREVVAIRRQSKTAAFRIPAIRTVSKINPSTLPAKRSDTLRSIRSMKYPRSSRGRDRVTRRI